jgi:DNA modification methylase
MKSHDQDLFGEPVMPRQKLSANFGAPPFSVLSARDGEWQRRKRWWRSIGLSGEVGRDAPAINLGSDGNSEEYTSIFDPALAELLVSWFSASGDTVIDPFAGGPSRGVVSAAMGRNYYGMDLRHEQVSANHSCVEGLRIELTGNPSWMCGDAVNDASLLPEADLMMTCPPYGNLEVYSDDPRDLSRMDRHAFAFAYKRAMFASLSRLRLDRFAVVVVGDYRREDGMLADFPSLTIAAARDAGTELYNDFVLVTAVGSASARAERQFRHSRKMARTHQNVLVFVKGNPIVATSRLVPPDQQP